MKLVLATPLYPPDIGGPATYAKELVDGLPAKGIEVKSVKFSDVREWPRLLRHYLYLRKVLRAARDADAILALDPASAGLPAMKAAARAGKPFFVKIVGDYAWEQGRQRFGVTQELDEFIRTPQESFFVRRLQGIQTRVAAAATRVIVPSEYLKGMVTAWGVPEEKIEVIYNAAEIGQIGGVPEAVAALAGPKVASIGRLVPWKGFQGLIQAVALTDTASLIIAGEGPLRAELGTLAEKKLPGRHVFTGALSHADTLAIIKSADVFVLNSSYEGLSHVLIEALALGVPIIATRVGGNPEVIADGENGLLIPAGDTQALREKLALVFADASLRARLSSNARGSAQRFSKETMLAKTAALFTSLV